MISMFFQARALCLAAVAVLFFAAPGVHAQLDPDFILQQYRGSKLLPHELMQTTPSTPNPWTSLRPEGSYVDWSYWEARRYQMSVAKAAKNKPAKVRMTGIGGAATTKVSRFGTGRSQANTVQISGEFTVPPAGAFTPFPEDEGSIPLASETELTLGNAIVADGEIGDHTKIRIRLHDFAIDRVVQPFTAARLSR